MMQKAHFQYYACWNPRDVSDFALSSDGGKIAIKCDVDPGVASGNDPHPNVHIYKSDGSIQFAFFNDQSGERGIAFWPDDYHILTTGCGQDGKWNADGLKLWELGSRQFEHVFADTPLTDINLNLFGVSPSGQYILGSSEHFRSGSWVLNTKNRAAKDTQTLYKWDQVCWSDDQRFAGIARGLIVDISSEGFIIESHSGETTWRGGPVFCFQRDSKSFLTRAAKSFGEIQLISLSTNEILRTSDLSFADQPFGLTAATFSRDGELLAIGPFDKSFVYILESTNFAVKNKIPLIMPGAHRWIRKMEFSSQGELIVIQNIFSHENASEIHVQVFQ